VRLRKWTLTLHCIDTHAYARLSQMGTMLPAGFASGRSLADVLSSCLSAVTGSVNPLGLRRVDRAVVILVDGLGAQALRTRAGHARFLSLRLTKATTITSGFPTTTAAALASLCTGTGPGQHGMVGYRVLDPERDRVFNQLSGWADGPDPARWQRSQTVFERSTADGVDAWAIGPNRYRDSPFSRAVLRGSQYLPARSIEQRFQAARAVLDRPDRSITYLYVPELDVASHAHGWESDSWLQALEDVDAQVSWLARTMRRGEGALVTADHGSLDVPVASHVLFDRTPGLIDGVRHVAGDPRCVQLHLEPELAPADAARLVERWRAAEGGRAWIATKQEAIDAGWFGARVDESVRPRIGDILVAARARIAYYDSRVLNDTGRAMIGQHGSLTRDEQAVPLIGLGDFE
jgi:hypothetical protein